MLHNAKPENEDSQFLSVSPNSCHHDHYFSGSKNCFRRARTLLILLLVLLVVRYSLQVGRYISSFTYQDVEIFQLQVFTRGQYFRSDVDTHLDTSKDAVYLQSEQDEEDKTFFCDRSHHRTDVCQMTGDVRVHGSSRSILLNSDKVNDTHEEKIRPYTRKWEPSVMATIDEITLRKIGSSQLDAVRKCDVNHTVPAVVFSTGGYTGNVYHEFNDGLIPLFITSQHLKGEVVLLILEYHDWWMTKYGEIVRQLSSHEVVDFNNDKRVHCFPQITVGLNIHDELTIDPKLSSESASMKDFEKLLSNAYLPRIQSMNKALNDPQILQLKEPSENKYFPRSFITLPKPENRPKLVIISRNGSRALLNQVELIEFAQQVGFNVEVLTPNPRTEMVDIYRVLNSCDVMIGVHGAAMTHFLFMRPGSVFIQIIPLGTDWAALTYYGEPAMKLGLDYLEYKITPEESSLSEKYARDDPALKDPESINSKGWMETKRVYLDGQDVRLSLGRFQRTLKEAYKRSTRRNAA